MFQRHAVQKLHDDERLTLVLADFVNGADIGMVQCRGSLRFALEAGQSLGILGYIVGQELERDETAEFGVLSLVHHSHTATSDLFDNAVVRNGLLDHSLLGTSRRVASS